MVTEEIEELATQLHTLDKVNTFKLNFSPEEQFVYERIRSHKALAHNLSTLTVLRSVLSKLTQNK